MARLAVVQIAAMTKLALLCTLVLLLTPISAVAQARSTSIDPRVLQPSYVLVEPGRRLSFNCIGSGAPTVVFEQGGEGMIFNWAKVQPALSQLTRTCFYDRAGFGWSDPPNYPVTGVSVTDDLRKLLAAARVEGPIVLVGHSIGGFYATLFADRFPAQVAGLVLVDPGFAGQDLGASPAVRARDQLGMRRGEGNLLRCAELARLQRLSVSNLTANQCFPLPTDVATDEERLYALNAITRPHWYLAEHSQSVNYFSSDEELSVSHKQERDAAQPFGEMPVVVISAGSVEEHAWRAKPEVSDEHRRWIAGHAALAARSTNGRHQVVTGAGHFIQKDQPDVVIAAVREVVEKLRMK